MLRTFTALSVLVFSLFAGGIARAEEYYTVSAYEFKPVGPDVKYEFRGGRGGNITSVAASSVVATLRIPPGKKFSAIYCQVLDASTTKDITVTLGEVRSGDIAGFGTTTLVSMATGGAPGATRIFTGVPGSPVVKTWDGGGPFTYYAYTVSISLGDTSNLAVKACVIEYF